MAKFFIDNGFGGKDEAAMQEHFEHLVGSVAKTNRFLRLWNNSYKSGTKYDFLMGRGKTKEEVFEAKAKAEGFTQEQIECFYEM